MKKLFKDYGLSITLFLLFVFTWFAHGITEWQTFSQEQQQHNQAVVLSEFWTAFGQSTFENWQSEFLQLFTMVILTASLSHKGSPESKDSEEKAEKLLMDIKKAVTKK